jgi:transposase
MSRKRKQYSSQFKAKVAIDAIRGQKTTTELASQYEIHPTMINNWKRDLLEKASELFDNGKATSQGATLISGVWREIRKGRILLN